MPRVPVYLLVLLALNAILYSGLLPLWEGFDEPFHFAYVQQLANGREIPAADNAWLSREVAESLRLAPASPAVQANLKFPRTYTEYRALSAGERQNIRDQLYRIAANSRWERSELVNYEAHHPPLAYLLPALLERAFSRIPLPNRVFLLRVIMALVGALLLCTAADRLLTSFQVPGRYRHAALYCILCCQMTWASIAHVANDWLAIPLACWVLVTVIDYDRRSGLRTAFAAGAVLSLGLLTKAYFLAFLPLVAGVCLVRRRLKDAAAALCLVAAIAGPWYTRNLVRYGDLTSMQETRSGGISTGAVLRAAPGMDWTTSLITSARGALWTGNNTLSTLSRPTLNLTLAVCFAAVVLWTLRRKSRGEWITVAYCALFSLALAYVTVVAHLNSGGVSIAPSPWYTQVLVSPLLCLGLAGASRWRRAGRIVAAGLILLFGYMLAATYVVKLIPLYGGFEERTSLANIAALYWNGLPRLTANLAEVVLVPVPVIYILTLLVIVTSCVSTVWVCRRED